MDNFPKNLTPKMVEGIKGFNLCAYLVGLEGWRRGLQLKYYVDMNKYTDMQTQRLSRFGRAYSLSNEDKTHYFYQSRGDSTDNETVTISNNKAKTTNFLQNNNIPMLSSEGFNSSHTNEEIISKANKIGYPVIIKPTYGTLSKGVILNIQNRIELMDALDKTRNKLGYKSIILERFFDGDDIRIYVINKKVVAALKRVPATIKGNGVNTIEELIELKNKSRKSNPYLAARPIKINKETREVLKQLGYKKENILEKDIVIRVKNKSTMTQGVDLYDITDTLNKKVKKLAINTLHSLPNIKHGSIDMLYDGKKAYVLEVNSSANISMHLFPTEGKPRNIPACIVDYYFPETINKRNQHQNMYFDYPDVLKVLKRNYTNYIEINPIGNIPLIGKKFMLYGKKLDDSYGRKIKSKAINDRLNGYLKIINNQSAKVVIAGNNEELTTFKAFLVRKIKGSNAIVEKVEEYEWNQEINIGFVIKEN